MAFNTAQFDLIAYNRSGEARTNVIDTVEITEAVTCVIGTASKIFVGTIINERVNTLVNGGLTRKAGTAVITETVSEYVGAAFTSMVLLAEIFEAVSSEISICADIAPTVNIAEEVTAPISLGANIAISGTATENIIPSISLGADLELSEFGIYELVNRSINVEAMDFRICYIGTSADQFVLKPGERVIIDASNYNVLLNGENAIWYQSGDWLDELNRETVSISISAASGVDNLTASILYTERYL